MSIKFSKYEKPTTLYLTQTSNILKKFEIIRDDFGIFHRKDIMEKNKNFIKNEVMEQNNRYSNS